LADPDLLAEPKGPVPSRARCRDDELTSRTEDSPNLLGAVLVLEHLEGDDDVERAGIEACILDVGDDVGGRVQIDTRAVEAALPKEPGEPHASAAEIEDAVPAAELRKQEGELAAVGKANRSRLRGLL